MRRLAIAHKFPVVKTFDKRPADIPENWLVFVGLRPLYGEKEWRSGTNSGYHYAAVDPSDTYMFKMHIEGMQKSKAELVKYVTTQDFMNWFKTEFEEAEEQKKVLSDPELMKWAKDKFVKEDMEQEVVV